jgi:2-polyprenyl-6-methoxyphenol hydroxylase-like FAD-dependent oxidoreductase
MEVISNVEKLSLTSTNVNVNVIDVLVIGGGPVGLAAALWFGKGPYKVVLIEQYGETKTETQRAFNERRQQVGINPKSLKFLRKLNVVVWGNIKTQGCMQNDWINIPICTLQDIFCKEIKTHNNVKILYNTHVESVNSFNAKHNARVIVIENDIEVYVFYPELIVIADGKHDDKGTARRFFNFCKASKVHFSTYGIIGIIKRDKDQYRDRSSICLANHSSNSYISELYPNLGAMHIRLLGSIQERYIALGVANNKDSEGFKNLSASQIHELLKEAYNKMRDKNMGEPEFVGFDECSKSPIPISLDYRKETIKLLDGSTTIASVEGDAARKTTFFSGSGLNSGFEGLSKLFEFCEENKGLIFSSIGDADHLLNLDQRLLEKDAASMKISLRLLIKGSNFISGYDYAETSSIAKSKSIDSNSESHIYKEPKIYQISPTKGEVSSHIYIKGDNLIGNTLTSPTITFSTIDGTSILVDNVIVYDNTTVGVKVPKNIEGEVSIILTRSDKEVIISPITFTIINVTDPPEILNIKKKKECLQIDGINFIRPIHITIIDHNGEFRTKGYCSSINSLIFSPPHELSHHVRFIVTTRNGDSKPFEKEFKND